MLPTSDVVCCLLLLCRCLCDVRCLLMLCRVWCTLSAQAGVSTVRRHACGVCCVRCHKCCVSCECVSRRGMLRVRCRACRACHVCMKISRKNTTPSDGGFAATATRWRTRSFRSTYCFLRKSSEWGQNWPVTVTFATRTTTSSCSGQRKTSSKRRVQQMDPPVPSPVALGVLPDFSTRHAPQRQPRKPTPHSRNGQFYVWPSTQPSTTPR